MGLHTNWHKTKIKNIGTADAPRTVHIDNQAAETVSGFTYLSSDIDSDGYSYPEIHRHLSIAGSMAQLDNVLRQQRLSLSTKLRIYTSLVLSDFNIFLVHRLLRKRDTGRLYICPLCPLMAQLDNVWRQQRHGLSTKLRIYTSLVLSDFKSSNPSSCSCVQVTYELEKEWWHARSS